MVRTRDFLLALLMIGFGIVATGTQLISVWFNSPLDEPLLPTTTTTTDVVEYTAVVPEGESRYGERLAALREKLLSRSNESIAMPADDTDEDVLAVAADQATTTVDIVENTIITCASYAPLTIIWNPQYTKFQDTSIARVVVMTPPGASSTPVTRLTLPLAVQPLSDPACLPTDVVGVALDGSLIRNNEYELYGVFGEGTLVGYALDGAAIYGKTSSIETDNCGGVTIDGQYRYHLSTEREGVLGCFGAVPQIIQ